MARLNVPLGADAERARMLAAERNSVPWRRWGPSIGPAALPGIVDEEHGIRLDLAFRRTGQGRRRGDRTAIEYRAATPTSSFLEASVELAADPDDAPPCRLDIQFAKRAPEDIVVALTIAAGFGEGSTSADLRVTLSLLPLVDGAGGGGAPSIQRVRQTRGHGLSDELTVLRAERPGAGTWWLVSDGSPVVVESDEECTAQVLAEQVVLGSGETRTIRLRLTRGETPRSPVGVDAAATLGTRASESGAYAASLLPATGSGGEGADTAGLLARLAWAPSGVADPTDAIMSAVALAVSDPATARQHLLACVQDGRPRLGTAAEPPLAAWATLRIHEMEQALTGQRDHAFLEGMFEPMLEDYSATMDRLDATGRNALQGGLLGLDGSSSSAAGAAWMGCYSVWMLSLAIELARDDPSYQDVTVTFLDTSLAMVTALDDLGGSGVGMWDEAHGALRDVERTAEGTVRRMPGRSTVGLVPLLAVALIPREAFGRLPDVSVHLNWSMRHQEALAGSIVRQPRRGGGWSGDALISLIPGERRSRALSNLDVAGDGPSPMLTCLLLDMIDRVRAYDTHEVPVSVGDVLAAHVLEDRSAPAWATVLVRAMRRSSQRD